MSHPQAISIRAEVVFDHVEGWSRSSPPRTLWVWLGLTMKVELFARLD
jgi:hypothetical protein